MPVRSWLLTLFLSSLAIFFFWGCRNRGTTTATAAQRKIDRRIELTIRSQYDIPADYGVAFGQVHAAEVQGYDELPVVFSHGDKRVGFTFLLSRDRRWLARLQKFDLHEDPTSGIDISNRPIRGNPVAPVTVVVYDDLQCPFCSELDQETIPQILDRYDGRVRVVYKEYPLSKIHSWAAHGAINANCLARQAPSSYWKYVDYVHAHYKDFGARREDLAKTFKKLDDLALLYSSDRIAVTPELRKCIKLQDENQIKHSLEEADRLDVQSTPTIYVNGERIDGLRPNEWLWAAIDRALAAAKQ